MQNLFNMSHIHFINLDAPTAIGLLKENQDEIRCFESDKSQVSFKSKKDTVAKIEKAVMILIAGKSTLEQGYGFVCVMKNGHRFFIEADIDKVNKIIPKH